MFSKRILIVSLEIILLIVVFLLIIWPMMSLFIWSIAETWYWPNTLPQKIGFDYWRQALGLQKSLAIGAVSIVPAFFLSLMIAMIVVVISMLIAIPAGYAAERFSTATDLCKSSAYLYQVRPGRNRTGGDSGSHTGRVGVRRMDHQCNF
jgi:ABC-type glycerol-3-phosphate transport system permease component